MIHHGGGGEHGSDIERKAVERMDVLRFEVSYRPLRPGTLLMGANIMKE